VTSSPTGWQESPRAGLGADDIIKMALRRRQRAARSSRRTSWAVVASDGRYVVDGDASTGIFAGARGRGADTVEALGPPPAGRVIVTISGKLHLAEQGDDD
jgi:hypothetical protein